MTGLNRIPLDYKIDDKKSQNRLPATETWMGEGGQVSALISYPLLAKELGLATS